MESEEISLRLAPLFAEMDKQCMVTDHLMDKDQWRIFLTTMWSNLVMDPENLDMTEADLEGAYKVIEKEAEKSVRWERCVGRRISFPDDERRRTVHGEG